MRTTTPTEEQFNNFIEFRQAAYQCLGQARDAQFELVDAVLLTPTAHSFVELALSPAFRRRWPSVYEAIEDGTPDRQGLLRLYTAQIPSCPRPLLAGDHTAWPRLSAPTLRDRTVEHQPTKISGQKPITIGQGYSTLAWLPAETAGRSWALPLLHERIASAETPIGKAVGQLRQVTAQLKERPISLWDAEYGNGPFVNATADIPADKIVRLRSNLCLRGAPPPYSGKGRPAIHGRKFKLSDPATWGEALATLEVTDPRLGRVRLMLWRDLHFRKSPAHPMVVVRIERLEARGTRRDPKEFWVAWVGQEPPPLRGWWGLYLRRFAIDHWYRLAKQRLHWTLPRFGTPERAEHWSDLLPLVSWELWLARQISADKPQPWQKRQVDLTPGRVAQGIGGVLAVIGTPTRAPKPRGKSPGWPQGRPRKRRERYEVVIKGPKRKKKAA
jgi:hypothetical protein